MLSAQGNRKEETAAPKVVILNDTSRRGHHGCNRVMRLLRAGLQRHGLHVVATSHARNNWPSDASFLAPLSSADLVVINGEGTLHHGKPAGRLLLDVVDHARKSGCPVALINAVYQSNPDSWGQALADCALLSARDAQSAAEMQRASGGASARVVPDLSMSGGAVAFTGARSELVVGDAVRLDARRRLARLALRMEADRYLPIKTSLSPIFRAPLVGRLATWGLFNAYNAVFAVKQPETILAQSEQAYISALGRANMHVTGRYHAVCFSVMTGTPFLAIGSNTWKIQALLDDIEIGRARLLPTQAIDDIRPGALNRPLSAGELEKLKTYLDGAVKSAEQLFADLAALAFSRRNR